MLSVFICEDNPEHLERITECARKYIFMENLDMEVACSATAPDAVLEHLRGGGVAGLYFLDVDLKCETNGIQLAEAIRAYDPRGFIVFVTADAESLMLTFRYKVEAMDYIVKGAIDLEERICQCIRNAYGKYTAKCTPLQNNFVFKLSRERTISLDCSAILYFETSPTAPHSIIVYTDTGRHEFRGNLSQIQKGLDKRFFKCHRSIIVNAGKVTEVDAAGLKLRLENGDAVDVAAKYVKGLKRLMMRG